MVSKHWSPRPPAMRMITVPGWLVEQFEIGEDAMEADGIPEGLLYDRIERFDVGEFWTNSSGDVKVQFEAASGQSNWWNTINVYNQAGDLVDQSEPGEYLIGIQEFVMSDGTSIVFEVVQE